MLAILCSGLLLSGCAAQHKDLASYFPNIDYAHTRSLSADQAGGIRYEYFSIEWRPNMPESIDAMLNSFATQGWRLQDAVDRGEAGILLIFERRRIE